MKIKKKAWPPLFQAVLEGEKNFDVRIADFNCEEGDTLVLQEWDPEKRQYTGREIEKEITFILKTKELEFFKPEDIKKYGFQIIGFI